MLLYGYTSNVFIFSLRNKEDCIHLRVCYQNQHMQFINNREQHLEMAGIFTLQIMLTATVSHTPNLKTTSYQKQHKTQPQSWPVHETSHLMTGKCFTLSKIPVHRQSRHQKLFTWPVIQLAINHPTNNWFKSYRGTFSKTREIFW